MCTEYLNEGDFQGWNLAVQEDTGKIELNLETDIDICSVDRGSAALVSLRKGTMNWRDTYDHHNVKRRLGI